MRRRTTRAGLPSDPVSLPGTAPHRGLAPGVIAALILLPLLLVIGGGAAALALLGGDGDGAPQEAVVIPEMGSDSGAGSDAGAPEAAGGGEAAAPGGGAGQATKRSDDRGARKPGGATLRLTLPTSVKAWSSIPLTVTGTTGDAAAYPETGGSSVDVWIANAENKGVTCPKQVPKSSDDRWGGSLAQANVWGPGDFRAAGDQVAPSEAGRYTVCGWVTPFPGVDPKASSLVASSTLRVVDAPMPAEVDFDSGQLRPGVYVASGADVVDAPPGARVEFEVVKDKNGSPELLYVAVTKLPTGLCTADGQPRRADRLSEEPATASLAYLGEATMEDGLVLSGGSPGRGEYHGQLGLNVGDSEGCPGHVAFVAKRVEGSSRPLRGQLRR